MACPKFKRMCLFRDCVSVSRLLLRFCACVNASLASALMAIPKFVSFSFALVSQLRWFCVCVPTPPPLLQSTWGANWGPQDVQEAFILSEAVSRENNNC